MAVMVITEFDGGTVEEYQRVNEIMGIHGDADAPDGLIRHVAGRTETGTIVVDLWESPEAMEAFVQNRLAPAVAQLDREPQASPPRVVGLHNHLPGNTPAGSNDVIMIAEIPGLSPEVYDQMASELPSHSPDGDAVWVSHAAAITDDGMLIVDIWESPEAFGQFAQEQLAPAAVKAGLPQFDPRFVPVHGHVRGTASVRD